jgi:hypothetical protein
MPVFCKLITRYLHGSNFDTHAKRGDNVLEWKPCGMVGLHCVHVKIIVCGLCKLPRSPSFCMRYHRPDKSLQRPVSSTLQQNIPVAMDTFLVECGWTKWTEFVPV